MIDGGARDADRRGEPDGDVGREVDDGFSAVTSEAGPRSRAAFAHASEAEMARILDFYAVRWEYEPVTFPILWNLEGDVVESFSPDFYLPELDLFLEMTTLKQKLVRKKNRKLRRLRELYPDIRIKLFYARDFRAMLLKYGRLGLLESLSGTLGQVVPERASEGELAVDTSSRDGDHAPEEASTVAAEAAARSGMPPSARAPEAPLARAAALGSHAGRSADQPLRRRPRSGAERRRRRRAAVAAGVIRYPSSEREAGSER